LRPTAGKNASPKLRAGNKDPTANMKIMSWNSKNEGVFSAARHMNFSSKIDISAPYLLEEQ
jgi:hypothetical protein